MKTILARIPPSLVRFVVVGVTTVAIDGLVYFLLLRAGVTLNLAKAIGFVSGTIFAYFANRFWTFGAAKSGDSRVFAFILLYLASATLNVGVNRALVALLGDTKPAYFAAWFIATGASATLNYLGMRFFVFRQKPAPAKG